MLVDIHGKWLSLVNTYARTARKRLLSNEQSLLETAIGACLMVTNGWLRRQQPTIASNNHDRQLLAKNISPSSFVIQNQRRRSAAGHHMAA